MSLVNDMLICVLAYISDLFSTYDFLFPVDCYFFLFREDLSIFPFRYVFSSVAQLCPTLCNRMDCSTPGFPVHHQLLELAQTHVHRVGDAIQPSHLCHHLLLLHSIFPSIRVFSSESVFCIRWPKYWSFGYV